MGGGSWTSQSYDTYTTNYRGMSTQDFVNSTNFTAQSMYKSRRLAPELDPNGVMRECCDSEEHPNTLPVILALDVTGSMGGAAMRVAQKLNEIMTNLYSDENVKDIEFCVMGIGDLAYDDAPIQMSQFESDIRIAEQLDKIYFEAGGGGNGFESYTAAWYMGSRHCKLDCWKRGQKGIIITMGDELPNPYLPQFGLMRATGDKIQADIETKLLIDEVREKFDIYHIAVDDHETSYRSYQDWSDEDSKWKNLLGEGYFVATLDSLASTIVNIIKDRASASFAYATPNITTNEDNEVTW